jgi:hypothetical protein
VQGVAGHKSEDIYDITATSETEEDDDDITDNARKVHNVTDTSYKTMCSTTISSITFL